MRLVLASGILGFLTAVGGLLLGLSPWAALGIWAGSGPVAALVAILVATVEDSKSTQLETAETMSAA